MTIKLVSADVLVQKCRFSKKLVLFVSCEHSVAFHWFLHQYNVEDCQNRLWFYLFQKAMLYLTSFCSKETNEPGSVDVLKQTTPVSVGSFVYCVIEMTVDMLSEDEQCLWHFKQRRSLSAFYLKQGLGFSFGLMLHAGVLNSLFYGRIICAFSCWCRCWIIAGMEMCE